MVVVGGGDFGNLIEVSIGHEVLALAAGILEKTTRQGTYDGFMASSVEEVLRDAHFPRRSSERGDGEL